MSVEIFGKMENKISQQFFDLCEREWETYDETGWNTAADNSTSLQLTGSWHNF